MKTKEQISNFLKNRKYKSEMDFEGIKFYCKNKHGIRLRTPECYYPNPNETEAINYTMFAEWVEHGIGAGDAVKWGDCIGLVQHADIDTLTICLKIDRNGPIFDSFSVLVQDITKADKSVLKRLKIAISKNDMQFSNKFFVMAPKIHPKPGDIVEFTSCEDEITGCGILRGYEDTEDGCKVYMNCMFIKGGEVKYSMNEYLGMLDDYIFEVTSTTDYPRKLLETELNKVGKTWNHHLRRIEPLNMKVENGESYWYISDKMDVEQDLEKGKIASHKRYLSGNYYRDPKEAQFMLKAIQDLRLQKLAEPEESPNSAN